MDILNEEMRKLQEQMNANMAQMAQLRDEQIALNGAMQAIRGAMKRAEGVRTAKEPTSEKQENCCDCNTPPHCLHEAGCDMEQCPFCGGQLISCPHGKTWPAKEQRIKWQEEKQQ